MLIVLSGVLIFFKFLCYVCKIMYFNSDIFLAWISAHTRAINMHMQFGYGYAINPQPLL